MALIHADDFSAYGAITDNPYFLDGLYSFDEPGYSGTSPDPGGSGLNVFQIYDDGYGGGGATHGIRFILPETVAEAGMGGRMWLTGLPESTNQIPHPIVFKDADNNPICCVCVTPIGGVQLRDGGYDGAILITSDGPVVTSNGFWHLEAKYDSAAKAFELRVEGVTKLLGTGLAITNGSEIAQVAIKDRSDSTSAGPGFYFKDFVVWDTTGAENNDFLGSVICYSLWEDADVSLGGWTSSGPDGFSVLANRPPIDSTDFITAADPGGLNAPCSFDLSALPSNITSIKGLVTYARAKKTDGGDGNLQVGLISGASPVLGANRPITAAYLFWRDVFEIDPETGDPWTVAAVNAVKIQLNRTV